MAQLSLWEPEREPAPARAPADLDQLGVRLSRLGLPPFPRIATHRNQTVLLSWVPARVLRIHEGYAHAPDEVLQAIVRFVTPGVRRGTRQAARAIFLAFPVERFAPPARPRGPRPERERPGDRALLQRVEVLRRDLNGRFFNGALSLIPIRLSGRMRTRLGELRLDRDSGRPTQITLNRRHLRRDGWEEVTDTVLHELVHQWQAETGRPVDHGTEFRRKAREVGIQPRAVRLDVAIAVGQDRAGGA